MNHEHVWEEIYKTDYRAQRATSSSIRIEWCKICGEVTKHTSYHEILSHHDTVYTPTGVANADS